MAGAVRTGAIAPKTSKIRLFGVVVALIIGLLVPVAPAASALSPSVTDGVISSIRPTADLSRFQPGNIVSDAVFFYKDSMSEAQIQAFLEQRVPRCEAGYTCLKDWYDVSRTTTADAMCGAYAGGVRERASRIIYKVAQACGINPQVILVTLQKEQGLVTHVWPSDWRYTIAMGQGCPDTAACDTRYYGFFNQVFGAAWQLKRYANPPGTSQYFTWYAPGKTWNILFNPNRGCGSSPVYVQNQATANLYYYTPYQPNAAALRAGYAEGDGCSSYGNRNFYNYFTDWFGSTQVPVNACAQPASSAVTPADGEFQVSVASLNARHAPSTSCEPVARSLSQGTVVTRTGVLGEWWQIRINGAYFWVHGAYLTPTPPVTYTTSRLAGPTRYETAVEVSKKSYPNGASTVFLTSGTDFPDALAAGAAAGRSGGALLLTDPNALPAAAAAEITRLAPSRVVIIGGETRVTPSVEAAVRSVATAATLERIAGADRYETSRLVAERYFGGAASAYVVTGRTYADAVVAAALGGAQGAPVILVDGTAPRLDEATRETLARLGTSTGIIAGNTLAVSAGIEADMVAAGIGVQRYGGADRFQTSRLLGAAAYPQGAASALVATGGGFADALTGSILAAKYKAPLFTTPATCLVGATKVWMLISGVREMTLIGGTPSLDDAVARSVRC
ncbi:cell wall-binding repeat-containing protein [Microbacterium sp. NPDC056569]|uniref:cell wall-binding repeat-containing protein n=1 Tax=Microbacterium sp. NPDC056569 TaxID=3345867 RepID=UPI00366F8F3E